MSLSVRTLKHSFLSSIFNNNYKNPILILKCNQWYCQRSDRYYCHLKKSSSVTSLNNGINFVFTTTHSFCSSNDKTINDKSGQKSDQNIDNNNNNNNNRDKSSFPKTSIKEDIKGIQLLLI
jgi:hypothetical protein